jgi:FkbM family methyltransferase
MDALFRKLPPFKGKHRLARLFFKATLANATDTLIKGKYNCTYLLPNLIENISLEIFIDGIYEKGTSDFFVKRLRPGGIFLDLGANIGAISIPLCKQREDCIAVCVEAAPWLFSYLKQNLEQNDLNNVTIVNKALFNTDDEELNFYSPDKKFGKGSLSPVYTDKAVKVNTIKIDTLLDQLKLERVDMIKIDVEGYEYSVFQGAENLLAGENAPDILFELEDWAEKAAGVPIGSAQQLLMDKGYKLFKMDDGGELRVLPKPLTTGSTMLFATKRPETAL